MIKLDNRLKCLYDCIARSGTYDVVADIGCDHGKLALALLQNNIANKVFLIDISPKSLQKAIDLMHAYNIETNRYTAVVSDGMENVDANFDLAILSGMGGDTIMHILSNPKFSAKHVITSPQHKELDTKIYLNSHKYFILHDIIVYENKHFYDIIYAISNTPQILSEIQLKYGIDNLKNKPPTFMDYVKYLIDKNYLILNNMSPSSSDYSKIKNELNILQSIIKG